MSKFLRHALLTLLVAGSLLPLSAFADRTNDVWVYPNGATYLKPNFSSGLDLLIYGSNHYINFNTVTGSSGYGLRDNGGTMEFKNSGGSWAGIGTGGSGSSIWPFTTGNTNFGVAVQSTSTPEWFTAGLQASSTSQFVYASTTQLSASGSLCINGDCRTGWPSSVGSGLATTSPIASSNLLVYSASGAGSAFGIATSTLTASSPLTGSLIQIGSGGSLGCQTASGSQAGCLASADWTTFNTKFATTSAAYWLGTYSPGYFFSTSSVAYWQTVNNFFSTTSANYWGGTKGYLTGNQSITLSGDVTGTGATSITTTLASSSIGSNYITGALGTINGSVLTRGGTITVNAASSSLLTDHDTFTNTITGSISGNAGTATTLQTARAINGVNFDGSAPITILAASSTALTDANTWSKLQIFSNASSTLGTATTLWSTTICLTGDTCRTTWPSSVGSGLATTSPIASSNLLVYSAAGAGSAFGIATSTLTASSPLTGSLIQIGSGGSLGIQAASGSQNGYLSSADYGLLHTATTTFSYPLTYTASTNAVTFPATSTLYGSGTNGQVLMWSGSAPIWAATSSTAASSTLLTDNNTFSGNDSFNKKLVLTFASSTAITASGTVYANNFYDTNTSGSSCIGDSSGILENGNCVSSLASSGSTISVSSPTGAVNVDLNLAHANTWSVLQTFGAASTTQLTASYASSSVAYLGVLTLPALAKPSGSFLAVDNNGKVIATTTPQGGSASTTLLTDNNTFAGTQTFNNLTINGTCTGCGGGGGAWPFLPSSYAGVSNNSTTTPLWLKNTQLLASTTLATTATTSNMFVGNYWLSTSTLDYLDMQNTDGANYSLLRIQAPEQNPHEATMSLSIDVNGDNNDSNQEFLDVYNEHYTGSGASLQTGLRYGYEGTGQNKPIVFGRWNVAGGGAAKDPGNQLILMPSGSVGIMQATSSVDQSAMLDIASSTASELLKVEAAPGTDVFRVRPGGIDMYQNMILNTGNSFVFNNTNNNDAIYAFNNGGSGANEFEVSDFTGTMPILLDGAVTATKSISTTDASTTLITASTLYSTGTTTINTPNGVNITNGTHGLDIILGATTTFQVY